MSLHLPGFLQIVPPTALRQYFRKKHPDVLARTRAKSPEALLKAIRTLSPNEQEALNIDFENVEQLCDEVGQRALHSVAAEDQHVLATIRSAESNEARGILLLLANEVLFDRALAAAYADRRLNGRSWSAFSIDGAPQQDQHSPDWSAFEADIAKILLRADGSSGKLKIDLFQRSLLNATGVPIGSSQHLSIHREGLPIVALAFHGDDLRRETRRPVDAAAVFFDRSEMTVDVIAAGARAVRCSVAEAFAQNILGVKGTVRQISTRRFALNRLKQTFRFLTDPADGIRDVKLTRLYLERMGSRFERLAIEVDPSDVEDICTRSAQWFGDKDPLRLLEWSVRSATLRVVFHPEPGSKRDKVVSIELRREGSNIREQTGRHQILSQYLGRWGLIAVAS